MRRPTSAHRRFHALQAGLAAAETLLVAKGFSAADAGGGELPDEPVEERGP